MKNICLAALVIVSMASCEDVEIGNSKDVNPDAIFMQYDINGEEGGEGHFMARFRFAGAKGTTLVLNDSSHFSFDGKQIVVDTTSGSLGAYYGLPITAGDAVHTADFTDSRGKLYSNKIQFKPFSLLNNLQEPIGGADLNLSFKGLSDGDKIMLAISDTSSLENFRDIDTTITVKNNRIIIPQKQLQNLSPGPITIDVSKEEKTSLQNKTPEGGELTTSYRLQRKDATLKKTQKAN